MPSAGLGRSSTTPLTGTVKAYKVGYYTRNRDRILAYAKAHYYASRKLAAGPELALAKKGR